jgi:3-hydroxyacyl-CoA dehydrogenase
MKQDQTPIAVVGGGLIGASWTALFLAHGHNVIAWDPNEVATCPFPNQVDHHLTQLQELGHESKEFGKLRQAPTLAEAVVDSFWIQENAPENVQLKHALYRDIEAVAPRDAIIASSTSSLTWTQLSTAMEHKERFITAHPFNPPHLMPLVELFAADAEILKAARDFYERLGRVTVTLRKDAVGHIANRLASALWREAVNIVAEGIADVSDVDAALVHGPGLRWSIIGAHMAYHLGGGAGGIEHYLKHLGPSQERRWESLGAPRLTPDVCKMLVEGIATEADGRSTQVLEAQRDQRLISVLRTRRGWDEQN